MVEIPVHALARGVVRGVLVDADGTPFPEAELKLYDPRTRALAALSVSPGNGEFEQRVPPGRYLVGCVLDGGGFSLGEHRLGAGEVLDLGVRTAPRPGRLHLATGARAATEVPVRFRLSVEYPFQGRPVFRELSRGAWPPPEQVTLFAGRHRFEALDGRGAPVVSETVDVPPGEDVWLDLP